VFFIVIFTCILLVYYIVHYFLFDNYKNNLYNLTTMKIASQKTKTSTALTGKIDYIDVVLGTDLNPTNLFYRVEWYATCQLTLVSTDDVVFHKEFDITIDPETGGYDHADFENRIVNICWEIRNDSSYSFDWKAICSTDNSINTDQDLAHLTNCAVRYNNPFKPYTVGYIYTDLINN
jgi:hypothetical protein